MSTPQHSPLTPAGASARPMPGATTTGHFPATASVQTSAAPAPSVPAAHPQATSNIASPAPAPIGHSFPATNPAAPAMQTAPGGPRIVATSPEPGDNRRRPAPRPRLGWWRPAENPTLWVQISAGLAIALVASFVVTGYFAATTAQARNSQGILQEVIDGSDERVAAAQAERDAAVVAASRAESERTALENELTSQGVLLGQLENQVEDMEDNSETTADLLQEAADLRMEHEELIGAMMGISASVDIARSATSQCAAGQARVLDHIRNPGRYTDESMIAFVQSLEAMCSAATSAIDHIEGQIPSQP